MTENTPKDYGQSEHGNFKVIDRISTPHPYCIGPKHVAHAADRFSGMLSKECIEDFEKNHGPSCAIPSCQLKLAEHEQALLIECKASLRDPDDEQKVNGELHAYLLKIKDKATEEGYAGFAFKETK